MSQTIQSIHTETVELVMFRIGHLLCGLPISDIQEIKKLDKVTHVFHAPSYVRGVIQLRGQIVTLIDSCYKLGMDPILIKSGTRIVVLKQGDESIGLLVDEVEDSILADKNNIDLPPANIGNLHQKFFKGIYKLDHDLLCILNTNAILANDNQEVKK